MLAMKSRNLLAYCSGWTVDISAPAWKIRGNNLVKCGKLKFAENYTNHQAWWDKLHCLYFIAHPFFFIFIHQRLTPCFTVFAACAAFFLVSYCVNTSIKPMKYTSFCGAPEIFKECLQHDYIFKKYLQIQSFRILSYLDSRTSILNTY